MQSHTEICIGNVQSEQYTQHTAHKHTRPHAHLGLCSRYQAADLRHQHDHANLVEGDTSYTRARAHTHPQYRAYERRLAAHVGARDDMKLGLVAHKLNLRAVSECTQRQHTRRNGIHNTP
jgi:hypothetical protein